MHWIYLSLAIIFEVSGTISMKISEGFSKVIPSTMLILFYICSLIFLTLTLKDLEVSIAYAIWSGMGIVIITVIGFVYFNENISYLKVFAIALIIIGVVTLNMTEGQKAPTHKDIMEHESN
ncbi:multidrug efflux SMR transporter [Ornithinibacillus sp. BX22]|uniref:Multidrug efflux SMR transporter n=2 Tax=Ornithinibacillus TaxID=484508 RepID=A0A923L7H6_9BACI|nr:MULTISPECIES: multidrug efflux SMR transporter [Ornithinibacillus]MBC5637832.1 multidrug efflux SMR transporter [Ornithinibacillus hominis]MBS3681806.1 multidrug efflux SMR transporter [Ornithinibacillus massiliensis]